MRKFWEFLTDAGGWAVASNSASLVAYVLGIIAVSKWGASVTPFLLVAVSVPLVWIGAYIAWLKKDRQLDAERAKNQKPALAGEILEVQIGPTINQQTLDLDNSVVFLKVKAWNTILMPEVVVNDYQLMLNVNGVTYHGAVSTNKGWKIHFITKEWTKIYDLGWEYLHPLKYMYPQEDWLGFYVEGLEREPGTIAGKVELALIDTDAKKHLITATSVPFVQGVIKGERD